MSSARTQVGSTVTAFFSWWGTELAGLLPRALTRNGQSTGPHRIVSIEDGGLRLITPGGTSANGHGHPGDELLSTADAIAKLTRDNGRAASLIGVRLPYRACFSRRVELPTAAARDFPRLLALDLERATPFKPHDVRTAFFIEEAQRTPGKTAIRQLVAKRAGLDATIAALQDAGLTVTQADCWNADGQSALPVNFLDAATDASTQRRGWFWPSTLAASAAALTVVAGYTVLDRHDAALAGIKTQTGKLRLLVQEKRNREADARTRQAEVTNFSQVLASAPSKALALEELTRLLPDTARVTDLKLEGNTVDISGVAQSAIGLLPILEKSTFFVNAEQTAPVMADQREGKDRFSIRVRIRNTGAVP